MNTRAMGSQFDEVEEAKPENLTAESDIRSYTDGNVIYCLLIPGDKTRGQVLREIMEVRTVEHMNVQERDDLPWWEIRCPHGGVLTITNPDAFPAESTKSNCGLDDCWFVYYTARH